MRIGANLAHFKYFGEACFQVMKEYGFSCADYGIDGELRGKTEEDYRSSILHDAALAKEAGVTIWQVHGPWRCPPHDETPEFRAERFEVMQRSIRLTGEIGVRYWVIHPLMPFGVDSGDFMLNRFYQINEEFFRALLPIAKENNVTICFENMPMSRLEISPPEKILAFIHKINDENFKMCLDTGHAACLGVNPADAVRVAGKDLCVLHVHDNMGKMDDHMVPCTGVIDWKDFGKALTEISFDGVFSLESAFGNYFLPHASTKTRLRTLRVILDEIVPGGVTE